jgi:hypothetical protein
VGSAGIGSEGPPLAGAWSRAAADWTAEEEEAEEEEEEERLLERR